MHTSGARRVRNHGLHEPDDELGRQVATPQKELATSAPRTRAAVGSVGGAATGVWVIKITAPPGAWLRPTLICNGTAHSRFRVHKVPAGSPEDPLGGICKGFNVLTQNILQVTEDNGTTWNLAQSNSTSAPGALSCGNAPQTVGSAVFGPFCSAVRTEDKCKTQTPRCVWHNNACAPAPPPPPPPPPPPAPFFKVGQAKFYGANLLCELDAPNEVSEPMLLMLFCRQWS